MGWWQDRMTSRKLKRRIMERSLRASSPVTLEPLEPRLLLAGDLPSIRLIEADNRGMIVLTATADLNASTINNSSVEVTTAGNDQIFGTPDDAVVNRTVQYRAADRQIVINASVAADTRYRVRLDSTIIRGADGRFLDGEFRGADMVSGDGVQGGDLIFFTRRPAETVVRITTISGIIDVTMFTDSTPLTVQNFLNYANRGVWDTTFFHRSVANFVIQAGGFNSNSPFPRITQDPPVLNEPGITNTRGRIAMAKRAGDPNSATNEWFFNLANNASNLDNQNGGFTAFGEVRNAAGLAVMDALAAFQLVNASTVNGAFNELPVVDQNAVLTRPGTFTIFTSDLVLISRIAMLVDVTGEPSQQLNTQGSVVVGDPNGGSAFVQFFDLDQRGLGDLAQSVQVRFGRDGSISSITLRDGMPDARIGIYISGATSVGSITDSRRMQQGSIAFIVSTAPVSSIRINSLISGQNLNGYVLPGLSLDDDIDRDGQTSDPLAILIHSGSLQTLSLPGGVTGDVVARGGFGTVRIGGTASAADFSAAAASGRPASFVFDRVLDSEIRIQDHISSIRAADWSNTDRRPERITAPSIGSITISGNSRAGLAGNFDAGLDLSTNLTPRNTLGKVSIAGSIFRAVWNIRGPIASITVRGDANNWNITGATDSGAISVGSLFNSLLTFSGRVARFTGVEWQGGGLTASSVGSFTLRGDARRGIAGDYIGNMIINGGGNQNVIGSLSVAGALRESQTTITGPAGRLNYGGGIVSSTIRVNGGVVRAIESGGVITNSTVNIQQTILTLSATAFDGASLQGGGYQRITASGDARRGIAGDFIGEIRPTVFEQLNVKGDFIGTINVRNAFDIRISGDLRDSTLNFTLTPTPQARGFNSLSVGGSIVRTDLRAAGRVGLMNADAMIDSGIYVGAPAGLFGLPSSVLGFREGARLEAITLRGLSGGVSNFVNSFIVTVELNTALLGRVTTDNFGRVHGLATNVLGNAIEARAGSTTIRLNPRSTSPAPVGDFQIWMALTPPPVVTV